MSIMIENKQRKNLQFSMSNVYISYMYSLHYKTFEFSKYIAFAIHFDVLSRYIVNTICLEMSKPHNLK
jgi:hypothetical protein